MMSLSAEWMTTSQPRARARVARVAMTSSASTPGMATTGHENASVSGRKYGSWTFRSSGVSRRVAL